MLHCIRNTTSVHIKASFGQFISQNLIHLQTDQNLIAKICESSRNLSSALSHDEETSSSAEPRSKYIRSRTNSTSTRSTPARKSSKGSDDMIELAKTVQEGMAELAIFDDKLDLNNSTPEEVQKKMEMMKADLMHKIKHHDEEKPRKSSALRRMSTEDSIEEQITESDDMERPKSRGRRNSSVSFYDNVNIEENTTIVSINDFKEEQPITRPHRENSVLTKIQRENSVISMAERKRENSGIDRKLSGKPIDKYCKDIIQDIEKSSKVIDRHVKQFQHSRFESDQIVQQLQAVDKINELVSAKVDIPSETLTELNNNFKMLTEQVFNDTPAVRKRSISGRRSSRDARPNLLGDVGMSNQDMLDDLLGKK